MSKIYLVERIDIHLGVDEYHNFVVVAKSSVQARKLCQVQAADEGVTVWQEAATTVLGYPRDKSPRIVLGDFNAG